MADRRVKVIVEAEVSKFQQGTKAAAKATEDLAKSTDQASKATDSLGKSGGSVDGLRGKLSQLADESSKVGKAAQDIAPALAGIGAVGAAGFVKAVSTAASFDKAMSSVQAATLESEENMRLLSDAAIKAGADTAYSAEEAAGAIEELAKAGVSTTDVLNGGLDGALSLAAAGQLDVAKAAEIAASAMTQFGLSGSEIPHIADLLAAGAGKAQGSVEDMGMALNQVGLVADQTGLTIEETTGGLAAFASAGMTGSDAGTSFKSMLQRLNPQSEAAANLMEDLGLSAYDANGEFIGLSEYAGILQDSLKGMSAEQRNAALQTLFGADAIRAASVLYEQGAEGVEEWEQAVNEAGYASETAAALQNNLAGDLEKLGGAFDTAFLKAGTGANEVLRDIVQGAESLVDSIGQLPAPVLQAGAVLSGLVGAAGLLAAGFITVVPKLKETKDALGDLAPRGSKADKALRGVGKAATVATVGLVGLQIAGELFTDEHVVGAEEYGQALLGVSKAGDEAKSLQLDAVFSEWTKFAGSSRVGVDGLAEAAAKLADPGFGAELNRNLNFMNGWFKLPDDELTELQNRFSGLSDTMGDMVAGGQMEAAAAGFREVVAGFEQSGKTAEDALAYLPGYADALRTIANDAGYALEPQELLNWALTGTPPAALAAGDALSGVASGAQAAGEGAEAGAAGMDIMSMSAEDLSDALDAAIQGLQDMGVMERNARSAARDYQEAIDGITESVKTNGQTLDTNTEKGRANEAALDGLANAGLASAAAMAENGASHEQLQSQLTGTYNQLVTAAQAMGLTKGEAELLARTILEIPEGKSIETHMDEQAASVAQFTAERIEGIPDGVQVIATMTDGAQQKAFQTAESIKLIPGHKLVDVGISENGTAGQVQVKVDNITGKTEYVWVDDKGTASNVQQKIVNIDGVNRTVWVDDKGTIHLVKEEIAKVPDGNSTIWAEAETADAEWELNHAARPRYVSIVASVTGNTSPKLSPYIARPGGYTGGVVGQDFGLPRFAGGGRLPYYGLGTDAIVGIGSHGAPTALVDDGEWVIRERSSRKYDRLLGLINQDHASVRHLAGYAKGGSVGREWSGQSVAAGLDYERLAKAVGAGSAVDARQYHFQPMPGATIADALHTVDHYDRVSARGG